MCDKYRIKNSIAPFYLLLFTLLMFTVVLHFVSLVKFISINMAGRYLNQELWQEHRNAVERQANLSIALSWLEYDKNMSAASSTRYASIERKCSMLPAIAIAEGYRRDRDFVSVAAWVRQAILAEPFPTVQKSIQIPAYMDVSDKGDLFLSVPKGDWRLIDSTSSAVVHHDTKTNTFSLRYENKRERDRVSYDWHGNAKIPYWDLAEFTFRLQQGTFLTLESVMDRNRTRNTAYRQGNGQWEKIDVFLDGKELRQFSVSIGEPVSPTSGQENYQVDFAPVKLILDSDVGTCG